MGKQLTNVPIRHLGLFVGGRSFGQAETFLYLVKQMIPRHIDKAVPPDRLQMMLGW